MDLSSPAKNASRLRELLKGLHNIPDFDRHDVEVNGIQIDSRIISKGDLFIACRGRNWDARDFVAKAIDAGARAVCVDADDDWHDVQIVGEVPVVAINNLSENVSLIAGRFYDHPSDDLCLIGITGTNGKTSCCQFVAQIFEGLGLSAGTIGTLGFSMGSGDQCFPVPGNLTTPDSVHIQKGLRILRNFGARVVLIEMSSIGLDQHRGAALNFNSAVFTNLTRDHLDYHENIQDYAKCKKSLFLIDSLESAVVNLDDPFSREIIEELNQDIKLWTYSKKNPKASIYADEIILREEGYYMQLHTPIGSMEIEGSLLGSFNISNVLASIATVFSTGLSNATQLTDFCTCVQNLRPVDGRMQLIDVATDVTVLVDYAHTPDGLRAALNGVQPHASAEIWCVFGCGGERDVGKRSRMGRIVEDYSCTAVVTDDNPRAEDGDKIIKDILKGFKDPQNVKIIRDRAKAISYAINSAKPKALILIAGKGHENYQEKNGIRTMFNDVDCARHELLKRKEK